MKRDEETRQIKVLREKKTLVTEGGGNDKAKNSSIVRNRALQQNHTTSKFLHRAELHFIISDVGVQEASMKLSMKEVREDGS